MLHYLPEGWTEETYMNAKDYDWERLSGEVSRRRIVTNQLPEFCINSNQQLDNLMKRSTAENKLISAQNTARINAGRSTRGAAPTNISAEEDAEALLSGAQALVERVSKAGWQEFGYLMFRTHYSDEDLWESFLDDYDPILQAGIDRAPKAARVDRIIDKLYMDILSDDCMADKGPADVAEAFRGFAKDDDVQLGLRTKMCLFVDQECMESVIEPAGDVPPFVKAVDVKLGDDGELGYAGFFKVAISSLIIQFYPALAACKDTSELCPAENEIWRTMSDAKGVRVEQQPDQAVDGDAMDES